MVILVAVTMILIINEDLVKRAFGGGGGGGRRNRQEAIDGGWRKRGNVKDRDRKSAERDTEIN